MDLSIDVVKILILSGLLVMTFTFGMIPVLFIRYIEKASESNLTTAEEEQKRQKKLSNYWRLLSFLNCFAAGVFLATCFLELLPNVRHNLMKVLFSSQIYSGFPLAEFVMVVGLFFILIIEQIALNVKENSAPNIAVRKATEENDVRQPLLAGHKSDGSEENLEEDRIASIRDDHFLGGLSDDPVMVSDENPEGDLDSSTNPSPHTTNSGLLDSVAKTDHNTTYPPIPSQSQVISGQNQHRSCHERNIHVHSVFRSMFLLFALSLHAIFEGLTVGLQSEITDVLSIFVALIVHKSILSFSLGMNLMQSKISVKSAIKSVILFSVAAPIGVLIGMAIMDWDSTKSGLVHGILQGFASGTFLYIIFFEILPKEFNSKLDRLLKVLFVIIGYGVITGILFLGDDIKHPFCLINDEGVHP